MVHACSGTVRRHARAGTHGRVRPSSCCRWRTSARPMRAPAALAGDRPASPRAGSPREDQPIARRQSLAQCAGAVFGQIPERDVRAIAGRAVAQTSGRPNAAASRLLGPAAVRNGRRYRCAQGYPGCPGVPTPGAQRRRPAGVQTVSWHAYLQPTFRKA
jgi:hypothetical protein